MKKIIVIIIGLMLISMMLIAGCTENRSGVSATGVKQAVAIVQTDAQGHTVEQSNIIKKYEIDNNPATIRYIYVISPFTNKVMFKTAMKGKMTSSGKRLTPNTVSTSCGSSTSGYSCGAFSMINGEEYRTPEVTQDDGTYGTSVEYLYGFAMDGSMLQIYTGGATVLVSTKPLTIQDGVVNLQYVDEAGNPIK